MCLFLWGTIPGKTSRSHFMCIHMCSNDLPHSIYRFTQLHSRSVCEWKNHIFIYGFFMEKENAFLFSWYCWCCCCCHVRLYSDAHDTANTQGLSQKRRAQEGLWTSFIRTFTIFLQLMFFILECLLLILLIGFSFMRNTRCSLRHCTNNKSTPSHSNVSCPCIQFGIP